MLRQLLVLIAPLLVTTSLRAADDLPAKVEATPGTCFVYKGDGQTGPDKDPASGLVARIDLQPLQYKVENKPLPETRFRIGVLPKGEGEVMASDITTACTGEKLTFSCTMKCADKVVGKFRAEALPTRPAEPKADYLRLVIEAPTVLNGCSEGKKPFSLAASLVGQQIILKGSDPKACFR